MYLCKWLLIGDSLLVGFRSLPDQVNKAVVGNTPIGVIKTLESDLNHCPDGKVIVSLGSNVLFNNYNTEIKRIRYIVDKIHRSGREVIVVLVPAKGKYKRRATKFNNLLKTLPVSKFLPVLPPNTIAKDDIHVGKRGYNIWLHELTK